jgi:membrane-associated phospholipid phosphatase
MSSSDDNVRETQRSAEASKSLPTSYSWRAVAITFAVAAVILAISTAIVHSGKVSSLEEDVFHAINDLPGFLEPVMYVFQLLGILFVPLIVAIVAALYRKWWLTLCLVLVIPLKLFFEKKVIKEIVDRQRPGTSICHGDVTCGHFRGDVSIRGESFVSGHAIITGAIATLLFFYLGRTGRIVVIGLAVMNGIARVYLGAHNPLDVVGGGALGVCIGCILLLVFDPVRRDARHHARVLAKGASETA